MLVTEKHPPTVLLMTNTDPFYVFSAITFINGRAIHPSNILYSASMSTRKSELTAFLRRVEKFPYMKYFIVGVDVMSSEKQTILLKWVSSITRQK